MRPRREWLHFQDDFKRIGASSERPQPSSGRIVGRIENAAFFRYCCYASSGRHNHLTRLSSFFRSNLLAIPLGVPCCWMPNDGMKRPLGGLLERLELVAAVLACQPRWTSSTQTSSSAFAVIVQSS
ncbi:hypothetical protein CGRA01v4_04951 [Colletotrichum graminicola]|nr:hypothetical protein CGRA01v4_04951 [Colletotrichum graminicola]